MYAAPAEKRLQGWRTAPTTTETPEKETALRENVCAVKPGSLGRETPELLLPSTLEVLGEAWEDGGTPQLKPYSGYASEGRRLRQRAGRSDSRRPSTARKLADTGYTGRPVQLGISRPTGGGERTPMVVPVHTPFNAKCSMSQRCGQPCQGGDRRGLCVCYERQRCGVNAVIGETANPGPRP